MKIIININNLKKRYQKSQIQTNHQLNLIQKTESGIILSGASKEKPQIAEVIEVGPGITHIPGKEVKMYIKKGGPRTNRGRQKGDRTKNMA